jgi:hypothetical protein
MGGRVHYVISQYFIISNCLSLILVLGRCIVPSLEYSLYGSCRLHSVFDFYACICLYSLYFRLILLVWWGRAENKKNVL